MSAPPVIRDPSASHDPPGSETTKETTPRAQSISEAGGGSESDEVEGAPAPEIVVHSPSSATGVGGRISRKEKLRQERRRHRQNSRESDSSAPRQIPASSLEEGNRAGQSGEEDSASRQQQQAQQPSQQNLASAGGDKPSHPTPRVPSLQQVQQALNQPQQQMQQQQQQPNQFVDDYTCQDFILDFRADLADVLDSTRMEMLLVIIIAIFAIVTVIDLATFPTTSDPNSVLWAQGAYFKTLTIISTVILCVFTLENIFKALVFGLPFLRVFRNSLDLMICGVALGLELATCTGIFGTLQPTSILTEPPSSLLFIIIFSRVFRFGTVMSRQKRVRDLWVTLRANRLRGDENVSTLERVIGILQDIREQYMLTDADEVLISWAIFVISTQKLYTDVYIGPNGEMPIFKEIDAETRNWLLGTYSKQREDQVPGMGATGALSSTQPTTPPIPRLSSSSVAGHIIPVTIVGPTQNPPSPSPATITGAATTTGVNLPPSTTIGQTSELRESRSSVEGEKATPEVVEGEGIELTTAQLQQQQQQHEAHPTRQKRRSFKEGLIAASANVLGGIRGEQHPHPPHTESEVRDRRRNYEGEFILQGRKHTQLEPPPMNLPLVIPPIAPAAVATATAAVSSPRLDMPVSPGPTQGTSITPTGGGAGSAGGSGAGQKGSSSNLSGHKRQASKTFREVIMTSSAAIRAAVAPPQASQSGATSTTPPEEGRRLSVAQEEITLGATGVGTLKRRSIDRVVYENVGAKSSDLKKLDSALFLQKLEEKPIYSSPARILDNYLDSFNRAVDDWDFDVFDVNERTGGRPLGLVLTSAVRKTGAIDVLGIDMNVLASFVTGIEQGYRTQNPYHNRMHAADVTQGVHHMLTHRIVREETTMLDRFSAIIAAAIHDYGHPGVGNAFLIASQEELAIRYNDISVLENLHVSAAFMLMRDEGLDRDIVGSLATKEQRQECRETLIQMVLATDMTKHFEVLNLFKTQILQCPQPPRKVEEGSVGTGGNAPGSSGAPPPTQAGTSGPSPSGSGAPTLPSSSTGGTTAGVPVSTSSSTLESGSSTLAVSGSDPSGNAATLRDLQIDEDLPPLPIEYRRLLLKIILHSADVSNPARPQKVCVPWAHLVLQEFFLQGDRERELGLPISTFMDRTKPALPKLQVGFITAIVKPLYASLGQHIPSMHNVAMPCLENNLAYWKGKQAEEEAASNPQGAGGGQGGAGSSLNNSGGAPVASGPGSSQVSGGGVGHSIAGAAGSSSPMVSGVKRLSHRTALSMGSLSLTFQGRQPKRSPLATTSTNSRSSGSGLSFLTSGGNGGGGGGGASGTRGGGAGVQRFAASHEVPSPSNQVPTTGFFRRTKSHADGEQGGGDEDSVHSTNSDKSLVILATRDGNSSPNIGPRESFVVAVEDLENPGEFSHKILTNVPGKGNGGIGSTETHQQGS